MVPLVAQISTSQKTDDERSAVRRLLRLHVPLSASGDAAHALIHNISERGLLVETAMLLQPGDQLLVDLPETGKTSAKVIWAREGLAGCEFENPISKAAISAGLLKAPPEGPPYTIAPSQPVGVSHDVPFEPTIETEEAPWMGALTLASLLLGLAATTIFIIALLSFPFSVQ